MWRAFTLRKMTPNIKGEVDHALEVWRNYIWSICFSIALIRLSEHYTTIEHLEPCKTKQLQLQGRGQPRVVLSIHAHNYKRHKNI